VDGADKWGELFPAYVEKVRQQDEPEWDIRTLETLGMIPNYYLQYFYYTDKKLKAQDCLAPLPR
jgi:6-phospho-beta-glucosidase